MFAKVAAAFGDRASVSIGRSDRYDDDVGEPIVRAYACGPAWIGVTAFALAMPQLAVALRIVTDTHGPLREVTLDERRAGIIAAAELATASIDIKLAQLMSTTLMVIDVSPSPGGRP